MKIPKPSGEDKAYFSSIVPESGDVEIKSMFGNVAAFVNGNMFMGLFGADVGLRLGDSDREALLAEPGAGEFGPVERPMKEYVTIPAAWRADPERTADWVSRALERGRALPPKRQKRKG